MLAGQCIALLLSKLSSRPVAIATSNEKIQGLHSPNNKRHGLRSVNITTVGNVRVRLKLPYVAETGLKGIQEKGSHQWIKGGFYPFLQWLGLTHR